MAGLRGIMSLCWQTLLAALLLGGMPAVVGAQPLAEDAANNAWHLLPKHGQMIYTGTASDARMVFEKTALIEGGLAFAVESDAEAAAITGQNTSFRIDFTRGERHAVRLASRNNGYRVFLDDDPEPQARGAWIRILNQVDPKVSLTFEGGTYVNITFDAEAAKDAEPTDAGPKTTNQTAGKDIPSAAEADGHSATVLQQVRPAVFKVRASTPGQSVYSSGTGFVIDDKGFAVTNFHVIQGASGATAMFSEDQE